MKIIEKEFNLAGDKKATITELKGEKGTILFFYPKADTPGCTLESKEFSKRQDEFKELGYSVVGVSKDNLKDQYDFMCKYDLSTPLISDDDLFLISQLNIITDDKFSRSTFIVNNELDIIHEMRNVKPVEHIQEILDWLNNNK